MEHKKGFDFCDKKLDQHEDIKTRVFNIALEQMTVLMGTEVEGSNGHLDPEMKNNVLGLRALIKKCACAAVTVQHLF